MPQFNSVEFIQNYMMLL